MRVWFGQHSDSGQANDCPKSEADKPLACRSLRMLGGSSDSSDSFLARFFLFPFTCFFSKCLDRGRKEKRKSIARIRPNCPNRPTSAASHELCWRSLPTAFGQHRERLRPALSETVRTATRWPQTALCPISASQGATNSARSDDMYPFRLLLLLILSADSLGTVLSAITGHGGLHAR